MKADNNDDRNIVDKNKIIKFLLLIIVILILFSTRSFIFDHIEVLGLNFKYIPQIEKTEISIKTTQTIQSLKQTQTSLVVSLDQIENTNLEKTENAIKITQTSISLASTTQYIDLLNQSTITPINTELPIEEFSFEVFSNQGWQNTNIYVENGDFIELQYLTGQWTSQKNSNVYFGPLVGNASTSESCRPIPILDAALIYKIGDGKPNPVGYSKTITYSNSGYLYFRMNDCDEWLIDNDGSIIISIKKK